MSNYVSFNIRLAEILGLHTAIYLSELTNINEKAIRKSKTEDNFFQLDREYIKSRTTLSIQEQVEIENKLSKVGILERNEIYPDKMYLNVETLIAILKSPDEDLVKEVTKLTELKAEKKKRGRKTLPENLKSCISTTNEELRVAYSNWIDTIIAKQGWLSKQSIKEAEQIVDEFSNRNLDVALKIIHIADTNGYRDMQWAVNSYQKNYKVSYHVPITQTPSVETPRETRRLGSDVF
jgi:hypothetical protein